MGISYGDFQLYFLFRLSQQLNLHSRNLSKLWLHYWNWWPWVTEVVREFNLITWSTWSLVHLGLSESCCFELFLIDHYLLRITKKHINKTQVVFKGHLISEWFLGSSISSKKQTNEFNFTMYYDTSGRLVFVRFLEEIDDPKKPFRN